VDAAQSLRELLALQEHEVVVAHSGPEGLVKAREFHPEIVLCDIGLPGMDGYAVAAVFRADEELKGTYLVALSGYAQPEDLRRAARGQGRGRAARGRLDIGQGGIAYQGSDRGRGYPPSGGPRCPPATGSSSRAAPPPSPG
jgi:CheY-like chemotaxis protein